MIEVVPWIPNGDEIDANAKRFCKHFLAAEFDSRILARAWAVREGPRVLAVSGIREILDVPVFRSISEPAAQALARRVNEYLADRGFRGAEFFLSLERETPEQREASLAAWAPVTPAERHVISVR